MPIVLFQFLRRRTHGLTDGRGHMERRKTISAALIMANNNNVINKSQRCQRQRCRLAAQRKAGNSAHAAVTCKHCPRSENSGLGALSEYSGQRMYTCSCLTNWVFSSVYTRKLLFFSNSYLVHRSKPINNSDAVWQLWMWWRVKDIRRTMKMMIGISLLAAAVWLLSPFQLVASALNDADRRLLDAVVEEALRRSDIPGMVLSVVSGLSVLVERGYGVRNVSSGERMNEDTLMPLGSTTKAFTTALLALLIEKHATDTDAVKSVRTRFWLSWAYSSSVHIGLPPEKCFFLIFRSFAYCPSVTT